jgi:hypothetical protein
MMLDPRNPETLLRILQIAGAIIFLVGFAFGFAICGIVQ